MVLGMTTAAFVLVTQGDGRVFPSIDGKETLSWDPGAYFTTAQAALGYPKSTAIVCAMLADETRHLHLAKILQQNAQDCFGAMFGGTARQFRAMLSTALLSTELFRSATFDDVESWAREVLCRERER